ncbi:MAG: ribosome hibernation-promoting factor, HPF/YfiA family [Bacillota bacterium]
MKMIITGRHMTVGEDIAEYAKGKIAKFDKYFNSEIKANLTFSYRGEEQIFELTIPMKGGVVLRAEDSDRDMRVAIDSVVDKIARQIRKYKNKLQKRYRSEETIRFENPFDEEKEKKEEEQIKIVKSKRFGIKPMFPKEAAMQMELIGHDFFVFLNADTDEVNVIYSRKDGDFGLIEPYL